MADADWEQKLRQELRAVRESTPPHPTVQAEKVDRLMESVVVAITQAFLDGATHGKQPGQWMEPGRLWSEHVPALHGHAERVVIGGLADAAELRMHLRHCLTRCAMALALMDEPT
jgi:hypothetical protein